MQEDILATYQKGILQQLRVEVELLNQMIPHNATTGFGWSNVSRQNPR
jgi:hypothetical protein